MKKEDFLESRKKIKSDIKDLEELNAKLLNDYLESNKPFELGDRIVDKENNVGIVVGFALDWHNEVKPICKKEKKDGNISKQSLYVFRASDFRLADIF